MGVGDPSVLAGRFAQTVDDEGVRFHRLRVSLANIEPSIWRRVDVPSHANLEELHRVLQAAMGWLDYHLHAFDIGDRRYEVPDKESEVPSVDERTVLLSELPEGSRFTYEYDFGDEWVHEIVVERIHKSDDELGLCVDGARACPPEDAGGASRYQELLSIAADPGHAEHEEVVTWLGVGFDPDAFRLQTVNSALVALYREPPGPPPTRPARKRTRR